MKQGPEAHNAQIIARDFSCYEHSSHWVEVTEETKIGKSRFPLSWL